VCPLVKLKVIDLVKQDFHGMGGTRRIRLAVDMPTGLYRDGAPWGK
jgi:hypothetical protein